MQIRGFVAKESIAIKNEQLFTNSGVKQAVLFLFGRRRHQLEDTVLWVPGSPQQWTV